MSVAVLYARERSVYHSISGLDVWTKARDATNWPGGVPCVAHPPCRAWGKLAPFAKPAPGERDLAFLAVEQVRRNSGVLEHPVGSRLWREAALPDVGSVDPYGGFTVKLNQCDFGHRALKPTLLYCVGVSLPPMPEPSPPITTVERMCKSERESTPIAFAAWLVQAALTASLATERP